jgi:hypothetical protein
MSSLTFEERQLVIHDLHGVRAKGLVFAVYVFVNSRLMGELRAINLRKSYQSTHPRYYSTSTEIRVRFAKTRYSIEILSGGLVGETCLTGTSDRKMKDGSPATARHQVDYNHSTHCMNLAKQQI